jgi:exodeoxyribonuclease VII small subunit
MSETVRGADAEPVSLEAALERLAEIADRLDGDALELDASLALFGEGIKLLRSAERTLAQAEARVQQLLEDGTLAPWEEDR